MKHFYIYFHRRLDNNRVFYIGKGSSRSNRAYTKYGRSLEWNSIVNSYGYEVEIIHDNLSNAQAFELENKYLNEYENVVNVKKAQNYREMKVEMFQDHVKYSEESPSCLVWLYDVPNSKNKVAGSLSKSTGYWTISINNVRYPVHRIVYTLFNEILSPDLHINHKNHNKADNKIVNLELVTPEENNLKRKMHLGGKASNNTTGITGISYREISQRFVVSWRDHFYKLKNKSFSISKYGDYESAFDRAKLFKEYITGYTMYMRKYLSGSEN